MQCSAQCRPVAAVQRPALRSSSAFVGSSLRVAPLRAQTRPAQRQVCVAGLFGLGVPELAVIAGVAALIFGEWALERLAARLGQCRRRLDGAAAAAAAATRSMQA